MKDIKVYSSAAGSGAIWKASGFLGGAVVSSFPDLAIEDEGRLRNFNIREHFLTKLYAQASFRKVRSEGEVSGLIQFHIVANHEGLDYAKQAALYREHLAKALHRPPKAASKAIVFIASVYLILGSLHWESRLLIQFGEDYVAYQNEVSRMIPHRNKRWHLCRSTKNSIK
ncbi:MAG: hypothetical protein NTY37_01390 [Methanothrix sp.]|nr:hypothetical protein [Methanothrix sp.]